MWLSLSTSTPMKKRNKEEELYMNVMTVSNTVSMLKNSKAFLSKI